MIIKNISNSNIVFLSIHNTTYELAPHTGILTVPSGEILDDELNNLINRGMITVENWQRGLAISGVSYDITQRIIDLIANVPVNMVVPNTGRRYLCFMVVGDGDVTVSPGVISGTAVTPGNGLVYQAQSAGKQGGSQEFPNGAPSTAFQVVSPVDSKIVVWEGV